MESTTLVESGYADPTSSATPLPDTGLLCLVMLARFHGIATEPDQLAHEFADGSNAFTKTEILLAAKKLSLKAKAVSSSLPRLTHTPLPCMVQMKDGNYVILARIDDNQVL
ncbi:MAG: type I secretion system permease/ATPase, partial [Tolumonas sp.]